MKLYAPKYYKNFKCIADKCEHSCCIGWEIDIDSKTYDKYKALKNGYGDVINKSISAKDTPHFILKDRDKCPHLDEQGLCKIILNLGEDFLCDICREHPRFYNYTTVAEVGIGLSCQEAARTVLTSPDYAVLEHIGEVDAIEENVDFDGRLMRSEIYEILQDDTNDYNAILDKIHSKYTIQNYDDSSYLETLDTLEYLNIEHKRLFMNYSSKRRPYDRETEEYLKRFLAYLIYRHCTEAFDEEDFCERLAFCLFCERLLASLVYSENAKGLEEISKLSSIISEEIEYSEDNTSALTFALPSTENLGN